MPTRYIADGEHYTDVLTKVAEVRKTLWIATADIKDLHVGRGTGRAARTVPFLEVLADLLARGVEVRLIHAKEPGPIFRQEFDRYPILAARLERVLCPRVHAKMLIFDCREVYLGSANLTGAGIGMKSAATRNFECGVLSDEAAIVTPAMHQFDSIWMGEWCRTCRRRAYCGDPIV